jgi:pulcherriminic acid synthase
MSLIQPSPPPLLSDEHERDPYETYRILREGYPVHHDDSTDIWLVSRMADLRMLFKRKDVTSENYEFQIGQFHGRTLIEMEGKEHAAHRRLLSPFLRSTGLEEFVPKIRAAAASIIVPVAQREAARVSKSLLGSIVQRESEAVAAGAQPHGEFDLVSEFTAVYPITVTREMLGVPDEMHDTMMRWYRNIADAISNLEGAQEPYDRGMQTREEIREYLMPLIQERRSDGGRDLISLVARADDGGLRLTDEEICAFTSLVIVAGGETTDSAIASMFKLLIEHPEQLEAVWNDRRLIRDAFAEQLRFAPPVHMILRIAAADVEVNGVRIPKGAKIGMVLAAANRDEAKFKAPDEFDIFRDDNNTDRAFRASADHISFADGRHFCVGNLLAREEVEIATNVILDNMSGPPRFADGFEANETGIWFRAPHRLQIAFDPVPAGTSSMGDARSSATPKSVEEDP